MRLVRRVHVRQRPAGILDQQARLDAVEFAGAFTDVEERVASVGETLELEHHARQQAGDLLCAVEQALAAACLLSLRQPMLLAHGAAPLQQDRQKQQQRFGDQPGQAPFHQQPLLGLAVFALHGADVAPDQRRGLRCGGAAVLQRDLVEQEGAPVGLQQAQRHAALRFGQHVHLRPVQDLRGREADQQPVAVAAQAHAARRVDPRGAQCLLVDDQGEAGGQLVAEVVQLRQRVVADLQRTDERTAGLVGGVQRDDGTAAGTELVDFQPGLHDTFRQCPVQQRPLGRRRIAEGVGALHAQDGDALGVP
ncbi:hypothetical protein BAY1663_04195 [Pseudomonas sp. BAY1663]|nr:hypothetical protein BAY1663_04195 [Pseudomonas sp. BAY1663]